MRQRQRELLRLPISPPLPGGLDLTRSRVLIEAIYSDADMDAKAEHVHTAVQKMRESGGFDPDQVDEQELADLHAEALAVGWWFAGKCEPHELATLFEIPSRQSVSEHLAAFFDTPLGERFLQTDMTDRRRMITEVGTDFVE